MKKFYNKNIVCRNCSHFFASHCLYTEVKHGISIMDFIYVIEEVPCSEYEGVTNKRCSCLKWESTDNLEWLEMKAIERDKGLL